MVTISQSIHTSHHHIYTLCTVLSVSYTSTNLNNIKNVFIKKEKGKESSSCTAKHSWKDESLEAGGTVEGAVVIAARPHLRQ